MKIHVSIQAHVFREHRDRFDGMSLFLVASHSVQKSFFRDFCMLHGSRKKWDILYLSFKEETFEGMCDGRYYTVMAEERLR